MGLEWHKKQFDLAHEMGAVAYCGSLYGHTGVIKRHPPTDEEFDHMANGLALLAEYGQIYGVAIVCEPMSHFRTHLINTPDQIMHLMDLANHSNLYVLFDTYHMVVEIRDYAEAIHTVAPKLWGMHACENDRGVPGGGLVPWNEIFESLIDVHFDGTILMEAY